MSRTGDRLDPLPGHDIQLALTTVRAYLDCTCDTPPQKVHATFRSAQRAALRHYIEHAPDGEERWRARALLVSTDVRKPS